jgi:hypothetical protein
VHKYIFTRAALNESVTFGTVKPLDRSLFFHDLLLSQLASNQYPIFRCGTFKPLNSADNGPIKKPDYALRSCCGHLVALQEETGIRRFTAASTANINSTPLPHREKNYSPKIILESKAYLPQSCSRWQGNVAA